MRYILTICLVLMMAGTCFAASLALPHPIAINGGTGIFGEVVSIEDSGYNLFIVFTIRDAEMRPLGLWDCNIENNDYDGVIGSVNPDNPTIAAQKTLMRMCI